MHERYRLQATDGTAIADSESERKFKFAKNSSFSNFDLLLSNLSEEQSTAQAVGLSELDQLQAAANSYHGHKYKNSSRDEIANVNFLTTISHTCRPTSKYREKTNLLRLTN